MLQFMGTKKRHCCIPLPNVYIFYRSKMSKIPTKSMPSLLWSFGLWMHPRPNLLPASDSYLGVGNISKNSLLVASNVLKWRFNCTWKRRFSQISVIFGKKIERNFQWLNRWKWKLERKQGVENGAYQMNLAPLFEMLCAILLEMYFRNWCASFECAVLRRMHAH